MTTIAIKQHEVFFSLSPGKPLADHDTLFDFGGCFAGKVVKRELFVTNDSEEDVIVKPKSNLNSLVGSASGMPQIDRFFGNDQFPLFQSGGRFIAAE